MKLKTFILILLNLSTTFGVEISKFVVNGEDAAIEDFPYMAQVHSMRIPMCGAAIITDRAVLTAGHCLIFPISSPVLVTIIVGSSYRDGTGGVSHRTRSILLHPDYHPGPNVNDVAVIHTLRRISFNNLVQPIALHESEFIDANIHGVFTGWGFVGYGPLFPRRATVLQKMEAITIENNDCSELYNQTHRGEFVFDQKICVVSTPRTSVCGGDSGGPLVIDGKIAGVLSWRTNPCGDGLPDVFIRISEVRDWINSVI